MNTQKSILSFAGSTRLFVDGLRAAGRTVRVPHHTTSEAAYRGKVERRGAFVCYTPGELALANNGVLILTDIHEFRATVLEVIGVAWRAGHIHTLIPRPPDRLPGGDPDARDVLEVSTRFDIAVPLQSCGCVEGECKCSTARLASISELQKHASAILRGEKRS